MKLLIAFLLSLSCFAQTNNLQLISWFAGADIVGTTGNSKANLESDFYVREFEFSAFASIDQTFDGVLTLAYHYELANAEEHMEVHEAFLFSSKLFDLANVKIGKFFLGLGRLNRFHRHDWIFTEAPFVQKSFFGNEGAKDTGIEYKRNLLSLGSSITFGLTSGNEFNHTAEHNHDEGEEHDHENANGPTFYTRFAKFVEFTPIKGFEVAANFVNRKDEESVQHQYLGLDFIYKDRFGRMIKKLVQSEIWARKSKDDDDEHTDMGAYIYFEKGINQHHSFGIRADYYKADHEHESGGSEEEHSIDGLDVEDSLTALSLSYNYYNSEFMRTRVTLEHGDGIEVENSDTDSYTKLSVQFVFNIGAHPAHVY